MITRESPSERKLVCGSLLTAWSMIHFNRSMFFVPFSRSPLRSETPEFQAGAIETSEEFRCMGNTLSALERSVF